jgi:amino acid permease
MENGLVLGTILIILGGILSGYTGTMLIRSSNHAGYIKFEDIAHELYGRSFGIANTIFILLALIATNISYIVYVSLDDNVGSNMLNFWEDYDMSIP